MVSCCPFPRKGATESRCSALAWRPPDQGFGAAPDVGATGLERQGSVADSIGTIHYVELDDDGRRFLRKTVDGGKGPALALR